MSKIDFGFKLESNLPKATAALEKALMMWNELTGGEMENLTHRDVQNRGTPVDTGRLRNSMAHAASDDYKTAYIGTNVEYAEPVEEGARKNNYGLGDGVGAHMLRNAVTDVGEASEKYLKEALEAQNIE